MPRKRKVGIVVALTRPTARIRVDRMLRHPLYGKAYRSSRHLLTHVEPAQALGIGDRVTIEETRALSKRKAWRVIEVVEAAERV